MKYFSLVLVCFSLISCASKEELKAIYTKAAELTSEGSYKQAIDLLENEVPKNQRKFNYYYVTGYCYLLINPDINKRLANSFFMKAYDFNQATYSNLYLLGSTFESMNDLINARKYFNEAVLIWETQQTERDKFAPEPYSRLSEICYRLGEYDKSLELVDKSLDLQHSDENVIMLKGKIAAKMGDKISFETNYKKALAINPENDYLSLEYGRTLIEIGETKKAYNFFTELIHNKRTSENTKYFSYLELLYLEILEGNYDSAYEYMKTTNAIESNTDILRKYKAFYLWQKGLPGEANNAFRIYRYFLENLSEISSTTDTDLTDFYKYFENDNYFKHLLQKNRGSD